MFDNFYFIMSHYLGDKYTAAVFIEYVGTHTNVRTFTAYNLFCICSYSSIKRNNLKNKTLFKLYILSIFRMFHMGVVTGGSGYTILQYNICLSIGVTVTGRLVTVSQPWGNILI